jgi:3-deoxy-D-manno-octulosonic acid kinase
MIKGGQRIDTAKGVMLADPHALGNARHEPAESLFDPKHWSARGELAAVSGGGRGSAWFIGNAENPWVLRHYRRGGFIARLTEDQYLWLGEQRVRAFVEWRLLAYLGQWGLRVPRPVAAWYRRDGLTYRCDLITERIINVRSLSAALTSGEVAQGGWNAIGLAIARLHRQGVDHADLNAHNILLDDTFSISIIDFDRGRVRAPGTWRLRNLARLHRSLAKISLSLPPGRFTPEAWNHLLTGYQTAGALAAG